LPRPVRKLIIEDEHYPAEDNPPIVYLPDWVDSLTLMYAPAFGPELLFPSCLQDLSLESCELTELVGLPPSLQRLWLEGCEELVTIRALPPIMNMVSITDCLALKDYSFLPRERVERLSISTQAEDLVLNFLPREVGALVFSNCRTISFPPVVSSVTGYLRLVDSLPLCGLAGLPLSVRDLRLQGLDLENEQIPGFLRHMTLTECELNLTQLPAKLESLTLKRVGVRLAQLPAKLESLTLKRVGVSRLVGLPESLVSLQLIDLGGLVSYEGMPLGLTHIKVSEITDPEDFPRLPFLESAELDYVMTKDGTEYTSGEQYIVDSKCRAKRPPTVSEDR